MADYDFDAVNNAIKTHIQVMGERPGSIYLSDKAHPDWVDDENNPNGNGTLIVRQFRYRVSSEEQEIFDALEKVDERIRVIPIDNETDGGPWIPLRMFVKDIPAGSILLTNWGEK